MKTGTLLLVSSLSGWRDIKTEQRPPFKVKCNVVNFFSVHSPLPRLCHSLDWYGQLCV